MKPTTEVEAFKAMPENVLTERLHSLTNVELRALASAIFLRRAPYSLALAERCLELEAVRRGWTLGAFRVLRAVFVWGTVADGVRGVDAEHRKQVLDAIARTPTHDEAEAVRAAKEPA